MAINSSRRYERVAFFCRVELAVSSQSPPIAAQTFDISLGGVGVLSPRAIERGVTVNVAFFLRTPRGELVERIMGRIAYVKADESGTRLGIEFLETLAEATQPGLTRRLESL